MTTSFSFFCFNAYYPRSPRHWNVLEGRRRDLGDSGVYLLSCVAFCFLQVPFGHSYLGWVCFLSFIWEPFLRCLVPLDWTFILRRRHSDLIGSSLPASETGSWRTEQLVVRRVGELPSMGFRRSFLFNQKRNPLRGSFCTCFPLFQKLRA